MADRFRFVALIVALLVAFCIVEATIEAVFFSEHEFGGELLSPDAHEVYIRSMGCAVIVGAAVIWRISIRRRIRMGAALQASKDLYRDLVENCPESIIVHRDERILFMNRMARSYLGTYSPEQLARVPLETFIHPDDRARSLERRTRALDGEDVPGAVEIRLNLPDGVARMAEVSSVRISFEGQPAVLTFVRDVTDEHATRKRLAASQERLSLALEAARDGVWDWDMVNDRLVYNQAWARMLGLDPLVGEHSPETWANLVHPEDKERALAAASDHIEGRTPAFEVEVRLRHADGHYIWVLDRGKVVERAADGRPLRMTGTHRDITARKEAELALELRNRIAEAFLIATPDQVFGRVLGLIRDALDSPVGVLATFESGATVRLAAQDRRGPRDEELVIGRDSLPGAWRSILEQARGRTLNVAPPMPGVAHPVARAVLVPILRQDRVLGMVAVGDRARDYDPNDLRDLESLAGYLAPILDFHLANKSKEGQLRQAQKMEAIGALAEGIAHDFNNILQAVLGFTTLALEEAQSLHEERGEFIANDLARVVKATQRGRELVNRILLFSRRQEQERQPIQAAAIIEETVELLVNAIPATIEITTRLDASCPPVLADPAQVELLLMNLATNGFHAMEQGGGVLEFATRFLPGGKPPEIVPESLRGRDTVQITVADTGCGMDAETLTRLFDPFFTTKDVGKGTGLGLSVVHGIVAAHEGEIVIESAVGRGTRAHVFLPAHRPEAEVGAGGDVPRTGAAAQIMAGSRILFLDDESDIGALGKALLEKQGHLVTAVDDTRVALTRLRTAPADFDLLITDLTMPHMTGQQIAAEVGRIRPDLPILLITGLNDLPASAWDGHPQIKGVLRKPFGGDTLRDTVRRVLAEAGAAAADAADPV